MEAANQQGGRWSNSKTFGLAPLALRPSSPVPLRAGQSLPPPPPAPTGPFAAPWGEMVHVTCAKPGGAPWKDPLYSLPFPSLNICVRGTPDEKSPHHRIVRCFSPPARPRRSLPVGGVPTCRLGAELARRRGLLGPCPSLWALHELLPRSGGGQLVPSHSPSFSGRFTAAGRQLFGGRWPKPKTVLTAPFLLAAAPSACAPPSTQIRAKKRHKGSAEV